MDLNTVLIHESRVRSQEGQCIIFETDSLPSATLTTVIIKKAISGDMAWISLLAILI